MLFITLTDSVSANFDLLPVIKLARRLLLRTTSAFVKVDKGKFLDDKITHSEHKDTSAREQWASIKTAQVRRPQGFAIQRLQACAGQG